MRCVICVIITLLTHYVSLISTAAIGTASNVTVHATTVKIFTVDAAQNEIDINNAVTLKFAITKGMEINQSCTVTTKFVSRTRINGSVYMAPIHHDPCDRPRLRKFMHCSSLTKQCECYRDWGNDIVPRYQYQIQVTSTTISTSATANSSSSTTTSSPNSTTTLGTHSSNNGITYSILDERWNDTESKWMEYDKGARECLVLPGKKCAKRSEATPYRCSGPHRCIILSEDDRVTYSCEGGEEHDSGNVLQMSFILRLLIYSINLKILISQLNCQ